MGGAQQEKEMETLLSSAQFRIPEPPLREELGGEILAWLQWRNRLYPDKNWAVKYLRGFNGVIGYILIALFTSPFSDAYQWIDIAKFWKAYRDGVGERLGIIR